MATHGKAGSDTRKALAAHKAFRRAGFGMSAIEGPADTYGSLPENFASLYSSQRSHIVYTVMSYRTPIAWILDTGEIFQPSVKYSVTTSNHQGMCYLLSNPNAAF